MYALLTHAQPFWADLHATLSGVLGGFGATEAGKVVPLHTETARAVCAVILATMFTTRAVKNFSGDVFPSEREGEERENLKEKKTQ